MVHLIYIPSLKYNTKTKYWSRENIGLIEKKLPSFGFKQPYTIAYNQSKIIYLNPKNQLITYQLTSSSIKVNDENYALYIDETSECQTIKAKRKKVLDVSNQ